MLQTFALIGMRLFLPDLLIQMLISEGGKNCSYLKKRKRKSNKSIKAHPLCLQAAWRTSIVHQSNSEADKFWEIGVVICLNVLFICCREKETTVTVVWGLFTLSYSGE